MADRSWRPAYPEALKQVAVLDLSEGEDSAQEIADRPGVYRPTLYSWRNKLLGHEAVSSMKRRKTSASAPEREELERQLEALQRDARKLQLEHDLLKKANELLKKGLGVDLQLLSNRQKTQLVDALREGRVAGAGLDVYNQEPLPLVHPFRSLDRAQIWPHLGYVTEDNYRLSYGQVIEEIAAFVAGAPIRIVGF